MAFRRVHVLAFLLFGSAAIVIACKGGADDDGSGIIDTPSPGATSSSTIVDGGDPDGRTQTYEAGDPPWVADASRLEDGAICDSVGRYQASKYRPNFPCCPGLNRLSLLTAMSSSVNGGPSIQVCDQAPHVEYACILGTCGDGVCEEPESKPCGCVADCPSAAWDQRDGGN